MRGQTPKIDMYEHRASTLYDTRGGGGEMMQEQYMLAR